MKMRKMRIRWKSILHDRILSRPFRYSRKVFLVREWEDGHDDHNSWTHYLTLRWK